MATGFGFKLHGPDTNPQGLIKCSKLAADTVRLGIGDPVEQVTASVKIGNGKIVQAVARAETGDRIFGVVVGVEKHTAVAPNFNQTYSPASTAEYLLVRQATSDDIWEVQEDAVSDQVQTTEIGYNADFIVADCSTTTGMSGVMLDSNTTATTNTLDLKVVGFRQNPGDVAPGNASGAVILVKFNKIANIDQASGV